MAMKGGMGMGAALAGGRAGKGVPKKLSMLEWLHTTCVKLDTEMISSQTEQDLCEQLSKLLQCGQDMFRSKQSPCEVCMNPEMVDPHSLPLIDWLNKTIRFFDNAWLAGERESQIATLLISMIQFHCEKFASDGPPPPKSLLSFDMMSTGPGMGGGGGYADPYAEMYPHEPGYMHPGTHMHPVEGPKPLPPIKLSICKAWQKDDCKLPTEECKFAHGESDFKGPKRFKTSLCMNHKNGTCELPDEKCIYAHGQDDLRKGDPMPKSNRGGRGGGGDYTFGVYPHLAMRGGRGGFPGGRGGGGWGAGPRGGGGAPYGRGARNGRAY